MEFDLAKWGNFAKPMPITGVAIHTDQVTPGSLFVALKGGRADGHDYVQEALNRGAAYALVERGEGIVVPNTLVALQEIAAAYRKTLSTKVIAITGSFGKTVTKDLLVQLLKTKYRVSGSPDSFNSQIGVPLSMLRISPDDEYAVIEVGVSRPGEMDRLIPVVQPDCAILTCVGSAHLATMGTIETTIEEKQKLLQAAKEWVIDPAEKPIVFPISKTGDFEVQLAPPFRIHFGRAFPHLRRVLDQALRAAAFCGLSSEEIEQGLQTGLPMPIRTGVWRSPYGATIIDDTPSTDPLSLDRARRMLEAVDAPTKLFREVTPEGVLPLLRAHEERPDALLIKGGDAMRFAGANQLSIDCDRIRQNVEAVPHRMIAVVKANAYGIGAVEIAKLLSRLDVDMFAVAYVHEAIALRLAGITKDILVFYVAAYEADQVTRWHLTPCVGDTTLADALPPCTIHIHVDTGMSRFGCRPEEFEALIAACGKHEIEGVMTHLTSADDPTEDAVTHRQLATFADLTRTLDFPYIHAHATAGMERFDLGHCNAVRIGVGLYTEALTLTTRITTIHTLKQGERVSYGGTYTVEADAERIGVIPLGFFDGIHRHYSNRGHVLIRGEQAPIVGTICMDFLMVKLPEGAEVNDEVLIFGEDAYGNRLPPEELAEAGGTKVTELITCLGPRIPRIYLYQGVARELVTT